MVLIVFGRFVWFVRLCGSVNWSVGFILLVYFLVDRLASQVVGWLIDWWVGWFCLIVVRLVGFARLVCIVWLVDLACWVFFVG